MSYQHVVARGDNGRRAVLQLDGQTAMLWLFERGRLLTHLDFPRDQPQRVMRAAALFAEGHRVQVVRDGLAPLTWDAAVTRTDGRTVLHALGSRGNPRSALVRRHRGATTAEVAFLYCMQTVRRSHLPIRGTDTGAIGAALAWVNYE